jgi:chromosome segregation ATPase
MLKMFNIYVDNPCNVMTQEESKKFIYSKNSEKYNFFLKATGLYNLKEDLLSIQKDIQEANEICEKHADRVKHKEHVVQELYQKLEKLKELENLEDKMKENAAKCFWADLKVVEEDHERLESDLLKKRQSLERLQSEVAKAVNDDHGHVEEMDRVHDVIKDIENELNAMSDEEQRRHQEHNNTGKILKTLRDNFRQLEIAKKEFENRYKKVDAEVYYYYYYYYMLWNYNVYFYFILFRLMK